jgi:hypothetical protein
MQEYVQIWFDFWERFNAAESITVSNSSELAYNSIYNSFHPHPTNCPNCGAALKTGTCEYCDSKIY